MRKTFLTICAAVFALVAVSSCYDDAPLWSEIDRLDGRIDSLASVLNQDVANLAALQSTVTGLETSLKKAIEDGDAAVKKALEDKLAAVETDLEAAIAAGDKTIADALTAEKAKIEAALETLQTGLTDVTGSVEKLNAALETLEATMGMNYKEVLTKIDSVDGAIDGKITNLTNAIALLKTADETFDAELAEAIAKIAVVKVEDKGGKIVLTLADGSTVELSKPLKNVDNEGLVTVVDVEGAKYWAVIVDGEPVSLDILVGAPVKLLFKVAEDGELQYSVNDSEWVSTGAYVAGPTLIYQGETGEYEYDENWEMVPVLEDFYTLEFGGQKYFLPMYKVDNSVVTIKAGKTYFAFGESKTIDVAVTDVTAMYVMTKPDGWRANLDGKKLTVTAPAEANVTSGVAEADGEVLLHCTTVEGTCKIAKLAVATTEGFKLTVDEEGNITIINPEVSTISNPMTGMEWTDFNDAYIGIELVKNFSDPVGYVQGVPDNYDAMSTMISNWKTNTADYDPETYEAIYTIGGAYVPGEYEIDKIESTVADLYAFLDWRGDGALPNGSQFVVWACPVDDKGMPRTEDLMYSYFSTPVAAEIAAVEGGISTSDIEVTVTVDGAESYYVGLVTEEQLYGWPIDDYMVNQEGPFGYFQMALEYGMAEYAFQNMGVLFGGENGKEMPEVLKASEVMGGALMPETTIYMWVFPVVDGLELADYTYENNLKPYIYDFTSGKLTSGGTVTVAFEEAEKEFMNVTVDITPSEGATMVYYRFYDQDSYNELEDVTADLLANGKATVELPVSARAENDIDGLAPGQTVVLAALAVDADGKYGETVNKSFTTKALEYSTTFTAEFGEESSEAYYSGYMYNFTVNVTGGEAAKYYYVFSEDEYSAEELNNLPLTYNYDYNFRSATSLNGLYANAGATYYLSVVVESAEGELAQVITKTVTVPAAAEEE